MFSFTLTRRKLFRGFCIKSAAVLFCVCALLFAGCDLDSGDNGIDGFNTDIVGTWTSNYGDHYVITKDHLTYYGDSSDTIGWSGEIVAATEFTDNSGVIIIKYDAGHDQIYYDSFENYGDPNHILARDGDYHGIYFNDLIPGVSVKMCGAYNAADPNGPETATLDEAKAEFTAGNQGTYAGSPPAYAWTAKQ